MVTRFSFGSSILGFKYFILVDVPFRYFKTLVWVCSSTLCIHAGLDNLLENQPKTDIFWILFGLTTFYPNLPKLSKIS